MATWREGDRKWAYRDDAAANIASDKVSLDPYRLESRRILALVKEILPQHLQRVEKASIDEVFLDLSAHVHSELLGRFPELGGPPPYDDPTEALPLPSISALDWKADALVDLEEEEESQDPDWDDVAILVGSEIVRDVRARIHEELGYTCSAGVANNKLLSKLGSGFKKPNCQTVVRTRAAQQFLADFKLTKIRNLGGKLGDQVVSTFHTDHIKELRNVSLDQFKAKFGDETAVWLYNTIRGVDTSEVNSRTQIKSMLSAKSFRPSIDSVDQAVKWLRIFVADIYARLVEEGVLDNKRRPRTINLQHRTAGQTRSRQIPIPQGKTLDDEVLFLLANELLGQIVGDGKIWPCANLSLSVGGFQDGVKGNLGIGAFLVKAGTPATSGPGPACDDTVATAERQNTRPRVENGGLHRFFATASSSDGMTPNEQSPAASGREVHVEFAERTGSDNVMDTEHHHGSERPSRRETPAEGESGVAHFQCSRCESGFEDAVSLQKHEDWHVAKDLQDEERAGQAFGPKRQTPSASGPKGSSSVSAKRGRSDRREPGQRKLDFG